MGGCATAVQRENKDVNSAIIWESDQRSLTRGFVFLEQFTRSRVQSLHGEAELRRSSRRDDNVAPLHKLLLPFDVVSLLFSF